MVDAIRPNFLNVPSLKQDEEAKKKGATDEERLYYGMYNTAGWKQFKQLAENLMTELDETNDTAISNGLPIEEIGKNAVVISLTKGVIKKLLNKVEDSREACERPDGGE